MAYRLASLALPVCLTGFVLLDSVRKRRRVIIAKASSLISMDFTLYQPFSQISLVQLS
jgi:hypothetical protein